MSSVVLLGNEIELAYGKGLPQRSRIAGDFPVFGSNGQVGSHNAALVKGPGIIVGRKGSIGEVIWTDDDFWPIDTTYFVKLRNPSDSLKYWYYQLKNLGLTHLNSHSAIPGLNREVAYAKAVAKRTPDEQRRIADVLGLLDEKIRLDERMNSTIEQIGRSLFHYYFIDNPDSVNWEEKSIAQVSEAVVRGFTAKYTDSSNIINLNQKVNKGTNLEKQHFKYYQPGTVVPDEKFAQKGDILINSLGQGTLGRVHHYSESTNNVVVDQHITIVRSNIHNYLYFKLAYTDNQRLQSLVSGTTGMLMLNVSKIRDFKVKVPPENSNALRIFDEYINATTDTIIKNNNEIQTLRTLRNILIPGLISGKVTLK